MGGTGGHFLSAFIRAARECAAQHWSFSEHGNAHSCSIDRRYSHGGVDNVPAVAHILSEYNSPNDLMTRYTASHCSDPDLALQYFEKIIKTCFTPDESWEVALAFVIKHGMDTRLMKYSREEIICATTGMMNMHSSFPALCSESSIPNILNISWKELLYNDPHVLLYKISDFVSIPVYEFPVEKLLTWRELTLNGIEKYKEHLSWYPVSDSNRHAPTCKEGA